MSERQINTPWDLLAGLIEQATGMTGDEVIDKVRVERGAEWVKKFKHEHPIAFAFIDALISDDADAALKSLAVLNPAAANLPFARTYLIELQKRLKGK